MGKKKKLGMSSLVERVEQLVNDALKRIDTLQSQVNDLREQMMERVGFSDKPADNKKSGTSASGQKSGQSGKTAQSGKGNSKSDLTQIKGIGPATAKKMQAKGITSVSQLANPSADDQKKLEEFRKLKSFASWQAEARKLV